MKKTAENQVVAQLLKVYKMEKLEKQGLKNTVNVYILKVEESI